MIWVLLGAVLAIGAMFAWARWREQRRRNAKTTLWKQLRTLVSDPAVVQRLVAAERARDPDASETKLLRKVIKKLLRDRGR
jgi:predicted negative regulator of RcsB-dependent stress response